MVRRRTNKTYEWRHYNLLWTESRQATQGNASTAVLGVSVITLLVDRLNSKGKKVTILTCYAPNAAYFAYKEEFMSKERPENPHERPKRQSGSRQHRQRTYHGQTRHRRTERKWKTLNSQNSVPPTTWSLEALFFPQENSQVHMNLPWRQDREPDWPQIIIGRK